jgi:hypothetical protein
MPRTKITSALPVVSLRDLQVMRAVLEYPVGTPLRFYELQDLGLNSAYSNALASLDRLTARGFLSVTWWNLYYNAPSHFNAKGAIRRWAMTPLGLEQTVLAFAELKVDLRDVLNRTGRNLAEKLRYPQQYSTAEIILAAVFGHFAAYECAFIEDNPYPRFTSAHGSWRAGLLAGRQELLNEAEELCGALPEFSPRPTYTISLTQSRRPKGRRKRSIQRKLRKVERDYERV